MRRVVTFLLLAISFNHLHAQPSLLYNDARKTIVSFLNSFPQEKIWRIGKINLEGNRITKRYIIMREVPLFEGQNIASHDLLELLEQSRFNLLNTALFLEVIPYIDSIDRENLDIRFQFKERWYIFPLPYFNIIDRNPNQWLFEQNADLDRVKYGVKFIWENLSGRRDQLRFNIINGYNREFNIYYEKPYSGKRLEHGFLIGAEYSMFRQMTIATEGQKQLFYPSDTRSDIDFVRSSFGVELGYTYRKGVNYRHRISFQYRREQIADSVNKILSLNQEKGYRSFFPGNVSKLNFAQIDYSFQYLNLNNNAYPWKGFALKAAITQKGLGLSSINFWQLRFKAGKFIPWGAKNSFAFVGFGLTRFPKDQPMYNLFGFGFGDMYVRGYEYYVIDCLSGAILKTTFRREVVNIKIPTFLKNSEKYRKIPFKIVAKIYNDLGATHYPFQNAGQLNNRLLHAYGFGIDFISYYDFVAQLEFSANQLGEKGLFLHIRQEF